MKTEAHCAEGVITYNIERIVENATAKEEQ